ncbi:hypothetical protein HPB49_006757 [Dermacentor silvarum]|uniref:Uncharacterized protein n=1 Tax=Dermacentor silvarum TaxID=543639 RepID=A0ACB8C2F6_DERSI|nr:hypothetical protein HPB49_006757 [Dermacentor silvarum]
MPCGTTSSPFLLASTLQHHLGELKQNYPETEAILQHRIYVHEMLCGGANDEEATKIYIYEEASRVFQSASMPLHQWEPILMK